MDANPLTIVAISAFALQIAHTPTAGFALLGSGAVFFGSLCIQCLYALSGAWLGARLGNTSQVAYLGHTSALAIMAFGARAFIISSQYQRYGDGASAGPDSAGRRHYAGGGTSSNTGSASPLHDQDVREP